MKTCPTAHTTRRHLLPIAIPLVISVLAVGGTLWASGAIQGARAAPTDSVLSGRVYEGAAGTEPPIASPIEGTIVSLYGANNPEEEWGDLIVTATTNISGWYGLNAPTGYEFYNIVETDPPARDSNGATSVSGTVRSDNWIQYDILDMELEYQVLTGNKFWDTPRAGEITCTSCDDCEAKLDGTYNVVRLTTDFTRTGGTGACIDVGADNVTFDCQGHILHEAGTVGEFNFGINLNGRSHVTVTGCSLSGFSTGFRLSNAHRNLIMTNTVHDTGNALFLDNSTQNEIRGNTITQNEYGLHATDSSNNNTLDQNVICKQAKQSMFFLDKTSGNVRSGNTCDSIFNWNGDSGLSACTLKCTPYGTSTSCSSSDDLQAALNGDYATVNLLQDVSVPGGLVVGGNHFTLDCNNHSITGSGSGTGILLDNKVGVDIRNCAITNYATGVELRSSGLSDLVGNTITNNGVGVALLETDGIRPQLNTLSGNAIRQNAFYGVQLIGTQSNYLSANSMWGNGLHAVWIEDGCDNTISGSTSGNGASLLYRHDTSGIIHNGGTYGQAVFCNVDNSTLRNITINNGSSLNDGVLIVDSSAITVANADLDRSRGIQIVGGDHVQVTNSDVFSSATNGIAFDGSLDGTALGNTVRSCAEHGIAVLDQSDRTTVVSNTVRTNADGIRVHQSDNVIVERNVVSENAGDGIDVETASGTTVDRNVARANRFGLYLDNATSGVVVNQNQFCYNSGQDIYSNSNGASGDDNTCSFLYRWEDAGLTDRCTTDCVGWYNMKWGYSFHNPSTSSLPWKRYEQTFGEDEVEVTIKVCAGVPVCIPFYKCFCAGKKVSIGTGVKEPIAYAIYKIGYEDLGDDGTCYGMAGTSLDFFFYNDTPSNYDPGASRVKDLGPNDAYKSSDLQVKRQIVHGSQLSTQAIKQFVAQLAAGVADANAVLSRARSGLQNRQMNAVCIKNGLTHGHVMNYDTVIDDSPSSSRIVVYDNNKEAFVSQIEDDPDNYPAITIDRSGNGWSYNMGSKGIWGNDAIFDLDYSGLHRSDWSLPLSVASLLSTVFGAGATAGMEDMDGNLLGYDQAGVAHEDIPGAMGYPVWGAAVDANVPARLLAQPGDYDIHIYGGETGPYTHTLVGLNGGYLLESIPATGATRDRVLFRIVNSNPEHNVVGFQTEDAPKPITLRLVRAWDPEADRRSFRIRDAVVGPGTTLWAKAMPTMGSLAITNRGTTSVTTNVGLYNELVYEGSPYPSGPPSALIEHLVLPPEMTQVIGARDWGDLGGSPINVASAPCGDAVCSTGEDHVTCPEDCTAATTVTPHDDMMIDADTVLSPGVYEIPDSGNPGVLTISGDDVMLDCNGAQFVGDGEGFGLRIRDASNITVTNCTFMNYLHGIDLETVTVATVDGVVLNENKGWGLHLVATQGFLGTESLVADNQSGARVIESEDVTLDKMMLCPNAATDIEAVESTGLTGISNACDTPVAWTDTGSDGCTYTCSGTVIQYRWLFLPVVMRSP